MPDFVYRLENQFVVYGGEAFNTKEVFRAGSIEGGRAKGDSGGGPDAVL